MPLNYPAGKNYEKSPYRYWTPDIHTKNPGFGAKGGILGAFQQPAEYLGRYAWEHYGGTEKSRALSWYYQKELRTRYNRWTMYNYGFPKKNAYEKQTYAGYPKYKDATPRNRYLRWRKRKQRLQSSYRKKPSWRNKQCPRCACRCKSIQRRRFSKFY